jgi:Holliday junction resolvasome RuvABC ATP-dependent DNA helicase subunit
LPTSYDQDLITIEQQSFCKRDSTIIFATSNEVEKLSDPLRSRFMELHLEEYTYDEFTEIVRRLLKKKYHLDMDVSEKIGYAVWNKMGSKDIRDAIMIAKLTKSSDDVDWLMDVQIKYGRKIVI